MKFIFKQQWDPIFSLTARNGGKRVGVGGEIQLRSWKPKQGNLKSHSNYISLNCKQRAARKRDEQPIPVKLELLICPSLSIFCTVCEMWINFAQSGDYSRLKPLSPLNYCQPSRLHLFYFSVHPFKPLNAWHFTFYTQMKILSIFCWLLSSLFKAAWDCLHFTTFHWVFNCEYSTFKLLTVRKQSKNSWVTVMERSRFFHYAWIAVFAQAEI